jgi:hypothetical protein
MQARKSLLRLFPCGAAVVLAGCSLLLMSGCHSKTAATNENYIAALNVYYASHDECLFPGGLRLPYQVSEKGGDTADAPVSAKGLDALKNAGMLERTEDKDLKVYRYTLTVAGSRATASFCYGHRVLTSIDSASEPTKVKGFPETQVQYHYTLIDVPIWAKSDSIQAAFPAMGKAVKGAGVGKSRLSQTMAGWQVPE